MKRLVFSFTRLRRVVWACGAVGSALPWHGRGRRFDPDQVHHIFNNLRLSFFRPRAFRHKFTTLLLDFVVSASLVHRGLRLRTDLEKCESMAYAENHTLFVVRSSG